MGIPRTGSHATRIVLNEIPAVKGKLSAGKLPTFEAEAPEAPRSRVNTDPDFKTAVNSPINPYVEIAVGEEVVAKAWSSGIAKVPNSYLGKSRRPGEGENSSLKRTEQIPEPLGGNPAILEDLFITAFPFGLPPLQWTRIANRYGGERCRQ
ncbi:hypothetical protein [Litchfieldella anticariensis]|uniref:hypothetical protein n=1 Tax=Litchfieldella anticariensis TaxID=258591 RepID=UPI0011821EF0|nr:hypothetical protein [Halomonas anticariensis]